MGCRAIVRIVERINKIDRTLAILYTHSDGHPGDIGSAIAKSLVSQTGDGMGYGMVYVIGKIAATLICHLQTNDPPVGISLEASDNIHANYIYDIIIGVEGIISISVDLLSGGKALVFDSLQEFAEFCDTYTDRK